MNAFEYPATDPRFNKIFNQAMHEHSTIFMKKILEKYNGFEGVKSLVDVGGGKGASLKMILSKHPSIKAFNFDLPHVIKEALTIPGKTVFYFFCFCLISFLSSSLFFFFLRI